MVATDFNRVIFFIPLVVYAVLPVVSLAVSLGKGPENAASVLILGASWLFLFMVVRSDLLGYWFRFVLLAIMLLAVALQWGVIGAVLAAGVVLVLWMYLRRFPKRAALNLLFPLRGGIYYVGHGGSNFILNHHYKNQSQRFAVDVLQINWAGFPARGILPRDLKAYEVFERTVYCPCDGVVTAAIDTVDDLEPPQRTLQPIAGNHVVIGCDGSDIFVGLAHLRKGSLQVQKGDRVKAGQVLGKVGNSGHTMEPHLHIQAKRGGQPDVMLDGTGVPITFSGHWLVRNSLWFSADRPAPALGAPDALEGNGATAPHWKA